jgi:acyl-CoA synthetase (AMP-forming)/AMP-acid ligase II
MSHVTLPGLTKVFAGGAPVFPRLLHKLRSMTPKAEIAAVYGSTEAEPIAVIGCPQIAPEELAAMVEGHGLLAGLPVPGIQLRILRNQWGTPLGPYSRAAFAAACLPPGQAGEIVVSGDHVLSGYLSGCGDRETKFAVDDIVWHRTGDAGYLDDRGRLWLLGRCAACIQDARGILYPFAVEAIAHHHPGIHRAAILSHSRRRILAIELDDNGTHPDPASLKAALARTEIDEVRVLRHLPVDRRHNAKIDYPALRELFNEPRKAPS